MKTVSEDRATRSLPALRRPGKRLLTAYFALSLFAVFYIPYFFPVSASTSDSYIFGYNNTVGIFLLLLLASIGAIWTKGLDFNFSATGLSSQIPLRYLWLGLAVELAACAGIYVRAGRHPVISEAEQQINRIWLISLGKRPYVDFDWPWGPLPLYFPKWLSDLLHLTIPQGYFLFWMLTSLIGIILLYATINLIDFPSNRKTGIFFLILPCAVFSALNMGSNYTWVRFLCPIFFILIVYRTRKRGAQIRAAILGVFFTGALLMVSPEVTIAHAFACIILLHREDISINKRRHTVSYIAMLAGFIVLFAFALKAHFLDSLFMDGKGAYSFPIFMAPTTLVYFGVVFVCACYVVQRGLRPGIEDNTAALIAFTVPMMAAALGRCDPGHILLNGIGFFIAVLFYASNYPRMWRLCRNVFFVCFLLLASFYGALSSLTSSIRPTPPGFPNNEDIHALYPQKISSFGDGVFEAPFGYVPKATGFYFSPQIDYGFYDGLWDATTPKAYRQKIDELAQHPQRSLLLWHGFVGACEVDDQNERLMISIIFAFPYTANAVHRESIRKPLCDYVFAHYTLAAPATPQNFDYELWLPKT